MVRVLKLFPGNSTISLLDVGCGNASFISLLAKRGFKVSGTEIALDSHFADDSRICRKDLEDCEFSDKSFDVITMWHALEHFIEPEKYLAEAKRILKDGGFLIIEIPNFYSWQSKLTKHDWFHLDVPRHLVHYESKTLVNFLEKSGFSVFKISHFSFAYSIFGFIQSVINIFIKRKNLLFDILNGKACLNFAVWRDLIITFLLIIPVSILAIPTAILESIFKKGGIITVFAEKKL